MSVIIPIGDQEKAYAVERDGGLALVRGFHSEQWPFTPEDAIALARYVKEIDGDGWVARELDNAELVRMIGVLKIMVEEKRPVYRPRIPEKGALPLMEYVRMRSVYKYWEVVLNATDGQLGRVMRAVLKCRGTITDMQLCVEMRDHPQWNRNTVVVLVKLKEGLESWFEELAERKVQPARIARPAGYRPEEEEK